MDDQQNQSTQPQVSPIPAPVAVDPMAPVMPPPPPMPIPDMGEQTASPMPAVSPIDTMAAGVSSGSQAEGSIAQVDPISAGEQTVTPLSATSPVTLEEVMAEMHKIEDKLVEMDEKL